jgi:hypothetical protein
MPIDPIKITNFSKAPAPGKTTEVPLMPSNSIESRPDLVTVAFQGLGICCFAEPKTIDRRSSQTVSPKTALKTAQAGFSTEIITQTPARCEIAIIRRTTPSKHILTIEVWETTDGINYNLHNYPNHGNILYGFDGAPALPDDAEISVNATQNPQIGGYAKYKPLQTLNNQSIGNQDAHDLGWIIDVEGNGFHNKKLSPQKAITRLSTMYIHNAEFYTRSFLTKGPQNSEPQPQTVSGQSAPIAIGHELGAKIPAAKVQLTVKSKQGGINKVFEFDTASGKRYLVKVGNLCYNDSSPDGDFDAIYEFLKETGESSPQFSVTPNLPPQKMSARPVPKLVPNPQDSAYIRFCGASLASKQDGIGEILTVQTMPDIIPTQF